MSAWSDAMVKVSSRDTLEKGYEVLFTQNRSRHHENLTDQRKPSRFYTSVCVREQHEGENFVLHFIGTGRERSLLNCHILHKWAKGEKNACDSNLTFLPFKLWDRHLT